MLEIIQPSLQATLQANPRKEALAKGLSMGGAADLFAAKVANLLLNQSPHLSVLEIISSPFSAKIHQDCLLAFSGAGLIWEDQNQRIFRNGSVALLEKGSTLIGKPSSTGYKAYLGIKSGFKAAFFEGSTSTDLRLLKGGNEGLLKKEDLLFPNNAIALSASHTQRAKKANWHLSHELLNYVEKKQIRLIPSFEHAAFTKKERATIQDTSWKINAKSNRMGIRLTANSEEIRFANQKLFSSTVLPGTVQITPEGPIILMQDAHTAGGYPRMGQVFEADLPILAQKRPGEAIKLIFSSIEEALSQKNVQQIRLNQLEQAIKWKYEEQFPYA